jgi:hypothetical protein
LPDANDCAQGFAKNLTFLVLRLLALSGRLCLVSFTKISKPTGAIVGKLRNNQKGFGAVEGVLIVAVVVLLGVVGYMVYKNHNKTPANNSKNISANTPTTSKTPSSTATPKTYTAQEAVTFAQKTYDDYLTALNKANKDTSNAQPVAHVGLAAVKDNLSSDLYTKAAAATQATPFSCTAQYVTDKYTASLSSSDKTSAVVAVSISNGGGLHTDGMIAIVDLTSLKLTSVTCPS